MRILVILIMFSSQQLWADNPFEKHLYNTMQAMSAFYMYQLSNGDSQYLSAFQHYLNTANLEINNSSSDQKDLFLKRWQTLVPHWKFKQQGHSQNLFLDTMVRLSARQYLTDTYLHTKTLPKSTDDIKQKIAEIKITSALLSARALDLLSAHKGSSALSQHDQKIDANLLAGIINEDINSLMGMKLPKSQQQKIKKAKIKFEFISRYITDYDEKTPYFLIYKSIISMKKLLSEKSMVVVGS